MAATHSQQYSPVPNHGHNRGTAATPPSDADDTAAARASNSVASTHLHMQQANMDQLRFGHSKQTAAAQHNFFSSWADEPLATASLQQIVAREQVYRSYVARDRDLEFSFAAEDFFETGQLLELQLEESNRRARFEKRALAAPGSGEEGLSLVVGLSVDAADLKERLRHCQTDETADRSHIQWSFSRSWRENLMPGIDAAFLQAHHKETQRVKTENKHHFQAPSVRGAPELASSSNNTSPDRKKQQQQQKQKEEESSFSQTVFPLFPEIDFSFLFEMEDKMRALIERTAMAELKGAQRALRAFQSEMLRDIAILRTKKAETLKRAYIVGYFFRFHLLMLQDLEEARRSDAVAREEKQIRDQIDVVENKAWLRAKGNENWRSDRESQVQMAEERKARQAAWELRRVHEEQQRNLIREELNARVGEGREEHFARAQLRDVYEKHMAHLRAHIIAAVVEREAASLTLQWNESFHGQIVVTERNVRRQIVQAESDGRSQMLSDEVRDYIQSRRDELFDQETAEAMRELDRHRGEELTASTLPMKMSSSAAAGAALAGLNASSSSTKLYPRPPSSSSVPGTEAFVRRG